MESNRKRALVTGASSGIGAAIARELATRGIDLVLTARRRDALDAVAATCKGVNVEIVTADLGQPDAAHALWAAASAGGPIDILINNAGAATSAVSTKSTGRATRSSSSST